MSKSIGSETSPLEFVVFVVLVPLMFIVTFLFTIGTLPDVTATLNGVFAPWPNLVVLLTVKVGFLLGRMYSLLLALDAL